MSTTSNRYQVTIEADPTLPIIRMTRDFDATPAQLMRAHTDPELFARWVGPNGIDDQDRRLGRHHRRPLALRRRPRRRGVRLPRLLPRGRRGPHRPDVHVRRPARRRRPRDAVVRGPRRRPHPTARPVARRQLRGPRPVAGQRHGDRRQRGLRQARRPRRGARDGRPGRRAPAHRRCVHGDRRRRRSGGVGQSGAARGVGRPRRRAPPRRVVPRVPPGADRHQAARPVRRSTTTRSAPGGPRPTPCRRCSTTRPPPSASTTCPHIGTMSLGRGRRHDLHRRRVPPPLGPRPSDRPGRDARPRQVRRDARGHAADGRGAAPERPLRAAGRRSPRTPTCRPSCWRSSAAPRSRDGDPALRGVAGREPICSTGAMFERVRGGRDRGRAGRSSCTCGLPGTGSPVVLLHGYPQSGLCWHRVAPALAERHAVVVPDLRGYGRSSTPPDDAEHTVYSKRQDGRRRRRRDGRPRPRALRRRRSRPRRAGRLPRRARPSRAGRAPVHARHHPDDRAVRAARRRAAGRPCSASTGTSSPCRRRCPRRSSAPSRSCTSSRSWGAGPARSRAPRRSRRRRWPPTSRDFTPAVIAASCADYRAGATFDSDLDDADRGGRTHDRLPGPRPVGRSPQRRRQRRLPGDVAALDSGRPASHRSAHAVRPLHPRGAPRPLHRGTARIPRLSGRMSAAELFVQRLVPSCQPDLVNSVAGRSPRAPSTTMSTRSLK